jgi:nucleoside-diphosphate-sugar epimerase
MSRISRRDLERKRRDRASRIFLTGATGFLGSHLAAGLIGRGYTITVLARPGKAGSAAARMIRLLDWFGVPGEERRRLTVVEGDIGVEGFGADPSSLLNILRNTDEIVHCASSTSFAERKSDEVRSVNLDGLDRVLEFAAASRAGHFHHVGTAYAAGKVSGRVMEEPVSSREFHNVYEETKARGEALAADACRASGIGLTVIRPSVVYGDSRTGRSLLFNAVYYPVRTALMLRDIYEKDIREHGGRRAERMGVRIGPDGAVRLPLRIEVVRGGGISLIPVDYFAEAFMAVMEDAPGGGIFHLANARLTTVEEIIDFSSRLFRLSGIRAADGAEFLETPRSPLEALYDHYLEVYGPYMRDVRVFDTSRSDAVLAPKGIVCPRFDYAVFERCMSYAVEVDWGARLFEAASAPSPADASPAA